LRLALVGKKEVGRTFSDRCAQGQNHDVAGLAGIRGGATEGMGAAQGCGGSTRLLTVQRQGKDQP
jgi:hypothetical protein